MNLLILALPWLQPVEPLSVPWKRIRAERVYDVASAQVPLPAFEAREGVLASVASIDGRAVRFEVAARGSEPPTEAWIDGDGDGARTPKEVVTLAWEEAAFSEVDLRPCGIEGRVLFIRHAGKLKATLRTLYHFEGELVVRGAPFVMRWIDMDASGAPSRGDRWIALPKAQLEAMSKPNGMFAARESDEPWHVGDSELRLAEFGADAVIRLELTKSKAPRHEFLAARHARVAQWWQREFALEGDEFLVAHKIEKNRPKAEHPVAWYHTYELADAQRHAKELGKPLLVAFSSDGCGWCKRLEWMNFPDAEVDARLRAFACVRIDHEFDVARTKEALGGKGVPFVVALDAEGKALHAIHGWLPPAEYVKQLDRALAAVGPRPRGK